MDSPLLEARPCPTCPGLIAGADPHRWCFECLGADHAVEGGGHSPSCSACRELPRLRRQHRLDHFEQARYVSPDEAQDQEDLEVVEMDDQEVAKEVPFVFAIRPNRRPHLSRRRKTRTSRCRALLGPVSTRVHRTDLSARILRW
ncbi:hypothetical protein OYC64_005384 [Pagothenia borchgrevinki]|uniref:Uncharacterized protein n=1 Tax=Pagothenia borchgrevinki TaxID=8213 RepID=A0ABD2GFQ7_PAGBO